MAKRNVVVFWTAEDRQTWIASELAGGRLRQGWGIPGCALTESGILLSYAEWAKRMAPAAKELWNWTVTGDAALSRYRILARMVTLKAGDLAVVPRIPRHGEFTIACVKGGYTFDDNLPLVNGHYLKDFGHVVQVDPARSIAFAHNSSPEAGAIAANFRNYRSAVSNVQNETYANRIIQLYEKAGSFG